jgi:hypothetical protein
MRFAAVASITLISLGVAPSAIAGAPKTTRAVGFSASRSIVVDLSAGSVTQSVRVVQVLPLRRGRCHTGARQLRKVARILGLTTVVIPTGDARLADRHRDGRPLRYLYQPPSAGGYSAGARSFGLRLVEQGLARVSRERGTYRRSYLKAERRARRHHLGAWACLR